MITIEKVSIHGLEETIRGMRNPLNSWDKSDSTFSPEHECGADVGPVDHDLMMRLSAGGPTHAKYRRMIVVYLDITAPLYWWKEFDTYKVGTVANSCSTMHKLTAKEFELDDFSHDHMGPRALDDLKQTVKTLNRFRTAYLKWNELSDSEKAEVMTGSPDGEPCTKKDIWWQMIQLLPSAFNQKRTVMLNYEVLAGIYPTRRDHKLDEWRKFCAWIEALPYADVIIGEKSAQ